MRLGYLIFTIKVVCSPDIYCVCSPGIYCVCSPDIYCVYSPDIYYVYSPDIHMLIKSEEKLENHSLDTSHYIPLYL